MYNAILIGDNKTIKILMLYKMNIKFNRQTVFPLNLFQVSSNFLTHSRTKNSEKHYILGNFASILTLEKAMQTPI